MKDIILKLLEKCGDGIDFGIMIISAFVAIGLMIAIIIIAAYFAR